MTIQQAKQILRTKPTSKEEVILFKQALLMVSTSWANI